MLAHQDFSEPVRVHPGFSFVIGDLIKFAKRLTERLADFHGNDAFAPSLNLRRIGSERVPEPDRLRRAEINRFPRGVDNFSPGPNPSTFPALIVPENPDQSTAKKPKQRMLDEKFSPMLGCPAPRQYEAGFQSSPLIQ